MKKIAFIFIALTALATGTALADAKVWAVHGIPGVDVDVYVNGDGPVLPGFQFGEIEGPLALPAGNYTVDIYGAGADPEQTDPVLSLTADLADGQGVALVAHLTEAGGLIFEPFGIDQRVPRRATSRLGIVHAAQAPPVDAVIERSNGKSNRSWIYGITEGSGVSGDLRARNVNVALNLPGTETTVFGPVELALSNRTITYVFAVGNFFDGSFLVLPLEVPVDDN